MEKLAVVLIRNDRRLHDHEGLTLSQSFDRYLLLALLPPQWDQLERIAPERKRFIQSSINAFAESLGPVPLHLTSEPKLLLEELSENFDVTLLAESQGAEEEAHQLRAFNVRNLLLTRPNRIFEQREISPTFTPFRKRLEKFAKASSPEGRVALHPDRALVLQPFRFAPFDVPAFPSVGESNARARVKVYLERYLDSYSETRNYLEAPDASSRFSTFLANGEVSARWIYQEIQRRDPENWLAVELLWREFFWHQGANFALPSRGRSVSGWENKLSHPLARAIFNELVTTGYISNRSRQILASFLVYEVGLDWKIGGAFFEAHLHDYDVFVNWGNWQYIAGVKFDPRGGRRFNLDLQQEKYDPDETYIRKWA